MPTDLFDRFAVIDVDTHLTEPPDVWTARVPAVDARHRCRTSSASTATTCGWPTASGSARPATTRWPGATASCPCRSRRPTTTSPRRCTTPTPGCAFLDEQGIQRPGALPERRRLRQRLLPAPRRPRARRPCVRGLQRLPHRLVQRRPRPARSPSPRCRSGTSTSPSPRCSACIELGHRAVNFCNQPQDYGQPPLAHAALGSDLGGGAGSGHLGQLPRRRRLDGHAVRRRRPSMGWMTNFAKVSSLIFIDNMRCIGDLIFGGVCHRFPDLKLVSVESGVGLDPRRAGDVRLAVAQRRRARRAPRVRPAAERVLPPPDLRLLLVRAAGRARRHRALPRQHPVRDRLPAPDVPAPRAPHARPAAARLRATELLGGAARRRRQQGAARQRRRRSTACRDVPSRYPASRIGPDAAAGLSAPDLGSRHVVAHVDDRVLHLRVDRVERRNAFTQDMYRGAQARRGLGRPPARARRRVPHRHRRVVRRRRRPRRRTREDPEDLDRRVGRHRPLPVPPHRALPQAVGGEDQRRSATPAVSTSPCTATSAIASDRARFRVPELLRGLPDPHHVGAAGRRRRAWPRPRYLFFTAAEIDATAAASDGPGRRGRARTTSSTPASNGSSSRSAAPAPWRAPRSSATSTPNSDPATCPCSWSRASRPRSRKAWARSSRSEPRYGPVLDPCGCGPDRHLVVRRSSRRRGRVHPPRVPSDRHR